MEASSTVLHLIATQSAGIFIVLVVFVSYTIPFWKKKKIILIYLKAHQHIFTVHTEKFLQTWGVEGGGEERQMIKKTQIEPVCLLLLCRACSD